MRETPVVIVGGGVIGVCAAYFLSREGFQVRLLERDEIGKAASFGNAGSIAPGHAPINRPGRMWQAIRWMFNGTSPLHVARPWDPALASWLLRFQSKCNQKHFSKCMDLLGPMGHETQALFDEIVEFEKIECDYRRRGYYEAYLTAAGMAGAKEESKLMRSYGYVIDEFNGRETAEREPALNNELEGSVYHREASTCQPYLFVTELAKRAEGYGAKIDTCSSVKRIVLENGRLTGVLTDKGEHIESSRVILATGAYSMDLLGRIGYKLPLQPAKGYHRDSERGAHGAPPLKEACILGEAFVFCTPMKDVVRFAGTLEFSGLNHDIRKPRLMELTEAAKRYFHEVGVEKTKSEWCGLRPCLPDGMPAVGWVPGIEGLYLANGHAMMGLTLGPITGRMIADDFLGKAPKYDRSLLDPGRYLG